MEINNFKRVITEKILYIIEYKWQKRTKCLHFVICRKQFLLFRTYLLEGDFGALLPVFSPKKHSIRIGRNQLKKLFHPDDMRKRKNTDPRRFFITKEKQQHSLNNIPSKKYKFFSIFSRKYQDIFGKRTYTFSKAGPSPRKQLIINAKNNKNLQKEHPIK